MADKIKRVFELGGKLTGSAKNIFSFTDKKMDKLGGQIKSLKMKQKDFNKELKKLDSGSNQYIVKARAAGQLGVAIDRLTQKHDKLNRSLKLQKKLGDEFRRTAQTAKTAGLGIAGGLTATILSTQSGANRLEEQRLWSQRLGMTTEALSRLVFVGDRYGVTQDAMIDGLKELQIRSDEFIKTGKGGGAESFERLGFTPEALSGAGGDVDKLFDLVQSRLKHVKDAAARQRLVDEIFGGTAGEQLAEMVSMTAEEFKQLKAEADSLGVTLTAENAKHVKSYMAQWRRTKSVFSSLHSSLSVTLMKPLGDAFARVAGYIEENKESITKLGQTFAELLSFALPKILALGGAIFSVIMTLGNGIGTVADFFGGFQNLAIVIGGVYALSKAFTIMRMAMLLGMGPVGWVIGALTALATGLTAFWAWVSGDDPEESSGPGTNQTRALPDVTTAREPIQINVTQLPGEDSEAFAQRVVELMEEKKSEQAAGAMFDAGEFSFG